MHDQAAGGEPPRRLAHQPALDGLRGLAVLAVVLFHAEVRWMRGGYVGVSVFFTLSGFLITGLLLAERRATGRIDAGAFYARRARRLLPASALCVLGVLAVAAAGGFAGATDLRGEALGATLQVANWVLLAGDDSYADLIARAGGGGASPLEHYWSLAIEEQIYWVWPVGVAGLLALARRRGTSLVRVMAALTGLGVAAGPLIAAVWGPDAAYWSTPARAGEVVTGALVAALLARRRAEAPAGRLEESARRAAPLALVAVVAACAAFPTSGGPAYAGLLPLLSLVTAALLLGLQGPGPARTLLSWRPLTLLGTISYGVYLYHWPLILLLDEARVGVDGPALLAVRLAATLAAAGLSYVLVERPIRRARLRPAPTLAGGAVATAAVVVAVLVLAPAPAPSDFTGPDADRAAAAIDPDGPRTPLVAVGPGPDVGPTTSPAPTPGDGPAPPPLVLTAPTPSRPVRIAVVGDSTAEAVAAGLVAWAVDHPELAQVSLVTASGCGFVTGGVRVYPEGDGEIPPQCPGYLASDLPEGVAALRPDVVLALAVWDVADRRWDGGPTLAPTDAAYRHRIVRDLGAATDTLLEAGASRVVWARQPPSDPLWNPVPSPQEERPRHQVLWDVMDDLAAAEPAVRVADLAGWLDAAGLAEDRATRPDGVHLSPEAAHRLARDWLGPLLLTEALT